MICATRIAGLFLLIALLLSPFPVFPFNDSDSLRVVVSTASTPEERIDAFLLLSRDSEGRDLKSALQYANQSLVYAENAKLLLKELKARLRIAEVSLAMNNYQLAMEQAEKAHELAKELGLIKEIATAQGIMAIIYAELGDFGRSMEINYSILQKFEKIDDKIEVGITMGNIGADYLSQKNYKMAVHYLQKALNIARELNDKLGMAHQYNNLSGIYLDHLKDYPRSLYYLREAVRVNQELDNKQLLGINYINMGITYFRLHKPDSALFYYTKGLAIFKESDSPLLIANGEVNLGELYMSFNERVKSIDFARSALEKGQKSGSFEITRQAAQLLHEIFLTERDSANAYKYAIIQHQAQDSLLFMQNQKEIYKLEFQYNFEKIDKARQIKQNRKNYILGLVIFALVSGIVIVLLINSRQRIKVKVTLLQKEKVESELGFKDKELTINLIALMKKNEMLSDIARKLISIEKKAGEGETRKSLSDLIHDIQVNADDKLLKEFSVRFQEVHEGFYHNLLQKFPDLTQSELKLCAYLRLNMSTKDIAELTGQRLLTVEHARYRLRKKLGISNSEVNLVGFLSQI
jgi:tetratricopeptide (TPR) repeat protein/DNA-binding CsgD family transcriptional regulator